MKKRCRRSNFDLRVQPKDAVSFSTTTAGPNCPEPSGVFPKVTITTKTSRDWACLRPPREVTPAAGTLGSSQDPANSGPDTGSPRVIRASRQGMSLGSANSAAVQPSKDTVQAQWLATMLASALGMSPYRSVPIQTHHSARIICRSKKESLVEIEGASHKLSETIGKLKR